MYVAFLYRSAVDYVREETTSLHIPYPFPFSQRIACHIQIFAMSRWLGVTLPVEYYELARGLQWSIPYLSLPWEVGHVQQVMVDSNPASGSKTYMSRVVDTDEFKIAQATQEEANRASQVYGLPLSPMEYETYFEVRKPSSMILACLFIPQQNSLAV